MSGAPDLDAIARAYAAALAHEKAGRQARAADGWRRVLALDPIDRGGAAVRLAALGAGPVPAKAPDAYVAMLFDQHAEAFDDILVEQLRYAVPALIGQRLRERAPGPFGRLLDLGCGTGLVGVACADLAGHVTGMDLAEGMVAQADERGLYDDLYIDEAANFLAEWDEDGFDLIVAADVLPYVGDLGPLLDGVRRVARPGAVVALSSETLPDEAFGGDGWTVTPFQRFAHRLDYVTGAMAARALVPFHAEPITVRLEQGAPIPGHLVLARA